MSNAFLKAVLLNSSSSNTPIRRFDRASHLIYGCETFEEKYEQIKEVILKNRCQYEFHSDVLDMALEDLDYHSEFDDCGGNVAPNAQHHVSALGSSTSEFYT